MISPSKRAVWPGKSLVDIVFEVWFWHWDATKSRVVGKIAQASDFLHLHAGVHVLVGLGFAEVLFPAQNGFRPVCFIEIKVADGFALVARQVGSQLLEVLSD